MNLKLKYSFLSLVQVTLRVQSFTTAFYAILIFVDVITNITTIVLFFRRVTWLFVIFWRHYEMRKNNHTHLTGRSVHSYKLIVTTKHLRGKIPTLWIKIDKEIKFWHTCRLFQLNPRSRGAIYLTHKWQLVLVFYTTLWLG